MQLLSAILRDNRATGAEAVAAARLLEAMERNDSGIDGQGLPPPTSRPEQILRAVRFLTAAGPSITLEALDIIARRVEDNRLRAYRRMGDTYAPMDGAALQAFRKKFKKRRELLAEQEETNGNSGESERFEYESGGAVAEGERLPELSETSKPIEYASDSDEPDGERASSSSSEA
jgi:hypothetical protein